MNYTNEKVYQFKITPVTKRVMYKNCMQPRSEMHRAVKWDEDEMYHATVEDENPIIRIT